MLIPELFYRDREPRVRVVQTENRVHGEILIRRAVSKELAVPIEGEERGVRGVPVLKLACGGGISSCWT